MLAALATAVNPASADRLAKALSWPPERVAAALDHAALEHAALHPGVGGALALHRTDTIHYTAAPALNLLTKEADSPPPPVRVVGTAVSAVRRGAIEIGDRNAASRRAQQRQRHSPRPHRCGPVSQNGQGQAV